MTAGGTFSMSSCVTVIACIPATATVLMGLDQTWAGATGVISGAPTSTFVGSVFTQTLGVSPENGELLAAFLTLSPLAYERAIASPAFASFVAKMGVTVEQFAFSAQEAIATARLKAMGINTNTNSYVGSITENFYRGATSSDALFPELIGVNTHYVTGAGAGVNVNCVSCTWTGMLRLAGEDMSAVAVANRLRADALWSKFASFTPETTTSVNSMVAEMLARGEGSFAPVIGIYARVGNNEYSHAFIAVVRNNKVYFVDPQRNLIIQPPTTGIAYRLGVPN
jgi:Papain fold toxin 1, glutamine deamidase